MRMTMIEAQIPALPSRKKVAAYARVSRDSERLLHSLQAQVSYYTELINSNPEWEYVGVYADEAVTGTLVSKRHEFQKLIEDCEAGKIDIVLTKSIQRFARNTVDLLRTVRHLKVLGVEVQFEKEHIRSMDGDGELMMTILASFAQDEIRNLSENVRWARRRKINMGEAPIRMQVTGYKWEGDQLVINPEEAPLIKRIFVEYMDGKSPGEICKSLKADGIKTIRGHWFQEGPVYRILRNPIYKGTLVLQKTYIEDPITKVQKWNTGELPKVMVEHNHEPIIPTLFFDEVQEEMARRKERWLAKDFDFEGMSTFTRKVKCGRYFYHHNAQQGKYGNDGGWLCSNMKCKHRETCNSKYIPDLAIRQAVTRAMGLSEYDEERAKDEVARVSSPEGGRLVIELTDGTTYYDYYRGIYESVEKQPKNKNVFVRKIVCGCCGSYYRCFAGYMPNGIRRATWNCTANYDNTMIHENVLKYRVAEALGWDEFSFERFKAEVEEIVMDRPCHMQIHLKEGEIKDVEYYADGRCSTRRKKDDNDTGDQDAVSIYTDSRQKQA